MCHPEKENKMIVAWIDPTINLKGALWEVLYNLLLAVGIFGTIGFITGIIIGKIVKGKR